MPRLAVPAYINATIKEEKNSALLFEAGQIMLQTQHPELAIGLFKKVINLDFSQFPLARLYLGISLLQSGQANDALNELTVFKHNTSVSDSIQQLNERYMKACVTAIRLNGWKSSQSLTSMPRPDSYYMQMLSPSLDRDNNFFFAMEMQAWSGDKNDAPKSAANLFTTLNPDRIEHPFDLPATINNFSHPSNDACISPDGNWLYFSRITQNSAGKNISHIYFSRKTGLGWSDAVEMNELVNEKNYNSKNPFVYVKDDRMHLIFCTDKPDGSGGFDLWEARLDADGQAILSNDLGSDVNSNFDEITPFYDESMEVLYFSSDGNASMGGFDIFRSERMKQGWSLPANIGLPYNSSANDCYYRCFEEKGFLQSDRSYAGKDTEILVNRIYTFIDQPYVANVCVKGFKKKLSGYQLSLLEKNKDDWNEVTRKEILLNPSSSGCDRTTLKLKPDHQYKLIASAPNYYSSSLLLSTMEKNQYKFDIEQILTPQVLMEGKVYFMRSDNSWDRALESKFKIYELQQGHADSLLFVSTLATSGKYTVALPAGASFRINISASGYFPLDTIISTLSFQQPGGMVYDFRLSQEIFGKENFIDSIKEVGDKLVLTPLFKSRFSAAIARMQNFIDEGKQVVVYCSRLPGHSEEAPKLPPLLEDYMKDQMGESWHAVWMDDSPKVKGKRVFKFYWVVSRD